MAARLIAGLGIAYSPCSDDPSSEPAKEPFPLYSRRTFLKRWVETISRRAT